MMFHQVLVILGVAGAITMSEVATATAATKCASIQAQCAVEIGGRCDPATGRWEYGRGLLGRGTSGGTNSRGAFDACVSRKLGQRK
jgi:hypothetical protein